MNNDLASNTQLTPRGIVPRQTIPNGNRRADWHDYHTKAIYMITINTLPETPRLSHIQAQGKRGKIPEVSRTPLGEEVRRAMLPARSLPIS